MNEQKNKTKRKLSLRLWLVLIITLCWVLPICIMGGVMSYYITHNITNQITQSVNSTVENAVKISASQLDSAVMASRYASYNSTIKDAYGVYQLTADKMHLYEQISGFLSQQYKYDSMFLISAFFLHQDPDTVYYTYNEANDSTYSTVRNYRINAHELVSQAAKEFGTEIVFFNINNDIYMVRNLMDANFMPFGVLVLQLDVEDMFGNLKNVAWQSATTVWLNTTPVVLAGEQLSPDELSITFPSNCQEHRKAEGLYYIYGTKKAETADISYIVEIDSTVLLQEMRRIQLVLIVLLIASIPFLVLIINFFTQNVTKPTKRLIIAARSIEDENYGVTVAKEPHNKEFAYLTDAFNQMSYKLQYQFNRIYKEELALRDARIMALQSQINPHFLNNTLEIINWESRLSKNGKITRMIEALSSMLSAASDREGKPFIRFSEEMIYVDSYLYIISERFGKRLKVLKVINPDVLEYNVPRLITQPIIENAVEHGMEPQQQCEIIIRAFITGNKLIIEVENNKTLSDEDIKRIEQLLYDDKTTSTSLGIRNVHQRLRILYGDNGGLFVKNSEKGHTVFQIVIAIEQTNQ
ncbi:MAG: sensor histidine kinase [Acetivibrionales bacterium]